MNGNWSKCYHCKSDMWLPQALYEAAYAAKEKFTFYCAYGHPQCFAAGESELDKMRRDRDRLEQNQAWYEERLADVQRAEREAQRLASTRKGQVTRLRNRAAVGVCPCCTRTVSQMARHMATKHPDFKAEEVA